jgi:hypothetical protein
MEKTGTFSHQNKILIHFGPGAGVKESSACRADWVNKRRLSGEKKSTTKLYTFLLPSLYVSRTHLYTFLVEALYVSPFISLLTTRIRKILLTWLCPNNQ